MDETTRAGRRARRAAAAGLLAAGALGGAALAGTLSASAADSTGGSATPSAAQGSAPQGHGGAQPVRSDESTVSSMTASTLRAAALKAVPGGTVYRIETDAGDGAYEAHMTNAGGSLVTVKFDKNLKVIRVEAGMGTGDPQPNGHG